MYEGEHNPKVIQELDQELRWSDSWKILTNLFKLVNLANEEISIPPLNLGVSDVNHVLKLSNSSLSVLL